MQWLYTFLSILSRVHDDFRIMIQILLLTINKIKAFKLGKESPVLVKLMMQTIYQNDRRNIKHIGAQQFGMKFLLRGLYAHNGLLYFHTRMENGTNMPYSVDFITFKVVDKKMAKRTAIQEQVLQPLRAYHQVMQVRGMGSEHTVFALEQFSLAEDKQLEVTLYERNGGRTLTFHVTAEDLQLAKNCVHLWLVKPWLHLHVC